MFKRSVRSLAFTKILVPLNFQLEECNTALSGVNALQGTQSAPLSLEVSVGA